MPFAAGGKTGNESPSTHAGAGTGFGFAWDVHGGATTDVYPRIATGDGVVTMKVISVAPGNNGAGTYVSVEVKVDGTYVGTVRYSHLINVAVSEQDTVTSSTKLGTTANDVVVDDPNIPGTDPNPCRGFVCSSSWAVHSAAGIHTHMSFAKACYGSQGLNTTVDAATSIALLSQNYAAANNSACDAAELNAVANGGGDGQDDIFAINRQDAGSNSTAVHVVNGSNWGQYLLNTGTALVQTDQTWDFAVADYNADGRPDLWAFNRAPGWPHTVLHILNGANLGQYLLAGNIVLPGVSQDWSFAVGKYNADTKPDIYAINRAPGTAHTEVRVIDGNNFGLYLQTGNVALPATDSSWSFAVGDYNADGKSDIYAINRHDAGSNSTAVHVIDGSNWGTYLLQTGTALIQTDQTWDFALGDRNGDSKPDLWAFNRNPGGGNTVVHVLNGANLAQYLQAGNIVLPGTDTNWSFRVGKHS
jgi:hypothetical protein